MPVVPLSRKHETIYAILLITLKLSPLLDEALLFLFSYILLEQSTSIPLSVMPLGS